MKKFLISIAIILAAVVAIIAYGIATDPRIKAAQSVAKLDDGLYTITYIGDYGFDEFLAQGGAATDADMARYITSFLTNGFGGATNTSAEYGCSSFVLRTDAGNLFGRNFDFDKDCRAMVVKSYPDNGYSSISTACIDFIGMGDDWQPDGDIMSRMAAIVALYLPLDGINEKGLYVADLVAGDNEQTCQNSDKADLTTTSAIRLLLNKAATVDQAVELLSEYDMHSSIDTSHHFAIADALGKAVVVEYIDGNMVVSPTDIVTNHYLSEGKKCGVGNELSHQRFNQICTMCSACTNPTTESVFDILRAASYPEFTQWSTLFNPSTRSADYIWKSKFDKSAYHFEL